MKQLSTAMTAAVAGGVLAGSLVLGLGIRAVRTREAKSAEPVEQQQQVQAQVQASNPAGQGGMTDDPRPRSARRGGFGDAQGMGGPTGFGGDREEMRQRWENMSEEERAAFRDQMRQRFSGGRTGGRRGGQQELSPEVQARVDELRANMESMSEEERAKAREEIMQLTGGSGRMGRRGGDEFIFRSMDPAEAEELRAKWDDMTEEEKQQYRDQARQRFEEMRQQNMGGPGGQPQGF